MIVFTSNIYYKLDKKESFIFICYLMYEKL